MKPIKHLAIIFFIVSVLSAVTAHGDTDQTRIMLKTTKGPVELILYNKTPVHRDNFVKLIKNNFFKGVLFHRVIKNFMIQSGDPDSINAPKGKRLGQGGPGYRLPAEILPVYFHKKGALSAARTGDNMNPTRRSSGSQFYIVTGKKHTDNELDQYEQRLNTLFTAAQREAYKSIGGAPFLDGQYTVFGEVTKGFDVISQIENVKTDNADRPLEDVKILSARIIE